MPGDANPQEGGLFQGIRFWLSQKVPQRSRFINDVRNNGGEILLIEKHADVKIVDHARKEALPGTHSYTYIEHSLRTGELADLNDHKVGPSEGTVRSVGSIVQPAKGTRNKYTQDDDRILWNWVHNNLQKGGGTDGNEIYKQLEAKHPQHPWQSWRDRWIKQLKGRPCPFPLLHNAPPTPPSDFPSGPDAPSVAVQSKELKADKSVQKGDFSSFDEEDAEALMQNGASILKIHPENRRDAWAKWARECDEEHIHTAEEWRAFWEDQVRPRYEKRKAKQTMRPHNGNATVPKVSTPKISTPKASKKVGVSSQTHSSPVSKVNRDVTADLSSQSYRPDSPSTQLISPSLHRQRRDIEKLRKDFIGRDNAKNSQQIVGSTASPRSETLKRKPASIDEEVPSSSPLVKAPSPKRMRKDGAAPPQEIASTPNSSPARRIKKEESPLFISSSDDDDGDSGQGPGLDVGESPLGKQPSDTLSEPDHVNANTQAMLRDVTQEVDFNVPPPEDGWDDESAYIREPTQQIDLRIASPEEDWNDEDLGAEASSDSDSTVLGARSQRTAVQETQAILRDKTPALDFEVADPEGGWEHVIPSSPPPIPSSPRAESEVSDIDAQTESWINAHAVGGVSIDLVIMILKAASMNTSLAAKVLKSMEGTEEIPRKTRGVWTESDDEDLGSTDARKIQRLESKHGKDCLTARWEFLNFYASA